MGTWPSCASFEHFLSLVVWWMESMGLFQNYAYFVGIPIISSIAFWDLSWSSLDLGKVISGVPREPSPNRTDPQKT